MNDDAKKEEERLDKLQLPWALKSDHARKLVSYFYTMSADFYEKALAFPNEAEDDEEVRLAHDAAKNCARIAIECNDLIHRLAAS